MSLHYHTFTCTSLRFDDITVQRKWTELQNRERRLYLGEVEEYLDGEGDDVHTGDAPVAAADECEDDIGGSALNQPLAALWGQSGGGLCAST